MAITTTNLPTLDSRYTNVSVSSGANQTQAQAIGNSIAKFYNTDLSADVQATQTDKANNIDNPQDDDKVASDLATLHNLDVQFAKASGDTADFNRLTQSPDQLLGSTTNQLLTAAGVSHKDTDFMYSGSNVPGGQQVDAHLKSDTQGNQGTSAYSISGNTVDVSNSSLGNTGKDWSMTDGSTVMSGGRYDAGDGQRITQNLTAGGNRAGFTPRQNADAYTYLLSLPYDQRNTTLQKSPDLLQIWNTGNAAMVNGNPINDSDAFNAVYKAFDTTSA